MAVNDVYRVEIFYNVGSELTQNVIHLRELVASDEDIPAAGVRGAVVAKWIEIFETALFSAEVFVPLIRTRRIKPTAGVPDIFIGGASTINGAGTGAPIPSTSALLVSLYTDNFTKTGRGRIYIPGLDAASQDDGQLNDAAMTLALALQEALEEPFEAPSTDPGEWELGVWSRKDVAFYPLVQAIAHSNLASQRGRRNFPGIST